MAGPSSSFVPPVPPVVPSKSKRRFRLDEANRTLPLVSRIVRDIVACHHKITQMQQTLAPAAKSKKANQANATEKPEQKELETAVDRLQGFVDELTTIGVELKDYQSGLIDFIGRHQGRDVYLCWKLGETSVLYWHELQAGFAGRQPITTLQESD